MGYFRDTRNVELSVIYYLETQIAANWSGITVVKAFTDAYKSPMPVVAIRLSDTTSTRQEIGSTTLLNDYAITIDIFAKSEGQRIDLADFIMDQIKEGCTYYVHSQTSGNPEQLTRVDSGYIHVNQFGSNMKIDFGNEGVDVYDQHRHFIQVNVRKV
jgi:hypothetical protein